MSRSREAAVHESFHLACAMNCWPAAGCTALLIVAPANAIHRLPAVSDKKLPGPLHVANASFPAAFVHTAPPLTAASTAPSGEFENGVVPSPGPDHVQPTE